MKKRTRGRELALQFLYQVDLLGADTLTEAAAFFKVEEPDGQARQFAERLVSRPVIVQVVV